MSFPPGTEMFQFPGFASTTYVFSCRYPEGWVAPFGYPRINACSRLPVAFRSVPRPSSPPSAKASTECPYHARYTHSPIPKDQTKSHPVQEPSTRYPQTNTASPAETENTNRQSNSSHKCTHTKQALLLSITHVGPTGLINRSITTTPLNVDAASTSQNVRKDELKQ